MPFGAPFGPPGHRTKFFQTCETAAGGAQLSGISANVIKLEGSLPFERLRSNLERRMTGVTLWSFYPY